MAHPKLLRALGVISVSSGALLLAGALPAFASPSLTASGTGTVMSQAPSLSHGASNQPDGVAVVNGTTYVANPADHEVDMYNAAGTYLSSITLSGVSPYPTAMVANGSGSHLYVVDNNATGSVFDIATATNTVANTFPVVGSPFAIAISPNGSTFYVISNNDSLIYAYATSDGSAIGHTVTDGIYATAFYVAVSSDGSKLYETLRDGLPAGATGGMRIINASTLAEITHEDLEGASGLAVAPDGSVWVGGTDAAFQSVVVQYAADGTFEHSVPVDTRPEALIVSHDSKWLYAATANNGTLDVIDTAALSSTSTGLASGDADSMALSADGLRLYSTSGSQGEVKVISIAKVTLTSPATVTPGSNAVDFSAQITDGTSPIADYTTNTVKFEVLDASNTVVATATVSPDAAGAASASLDLSTLPVGTYSVRATLDPIAGAVVVTAAGLKVADTALAATGVDATLPTGIALVLLLGGATMVLLSRRRTV